METVCLEGNWAHTNKNLNSHIFNPELSILEIYLQKELQMSIKVYVQKVCHSIVYDSEKLEATKRLPIGK